MVFRYTTDCGTSSQLLKTENVQIDAERETLLRLRVNNLIISAENWLEKEDSTREHSP